MSLINLYTLFFFLLKQHIALSREDHKYDVPQMLLIIDPSLRDLDLILSSRQPALLYNSSTATVTLATCATDAKAEATMQAKYMLASSHPILLLLCRQ